MRLRLTQVKNGQRVFHQVSLALTQFQLLDVTPLSMHDQEGCRKITALTPLGGQIFLPLQDYYDSLDSSEVGWRGGGMRKKEKKKNT